MYGPIIRGCIYGIGSGAFGKDAVRGVAFISTIDSTLSCERSRGRSRRVLRAYASIASTFSRAERARSSWRPRPTGLSHAACASLGSSSEQDFIIEWRFAEGRYALFPELAAELVRLNVDVIVVGTPAAVRPVQHATSNDFPIVMGTSTDPVGNGYVASLAHPGGNTTGSASSHDDYAPKQLQLLAMLVPNLSRIGFLVKLNNPFHVPLLKLAQAAVRNAWHHAGAS